MARRRGSKHGRRWRNRSRRSGRDGVELLVCGRPGHRVIGCRTSHSSVPCSPASTATCWGSRARHRRAACAADRVSSSCPASWARSSAPRGKIFDDVLWLDPIDIAAGHLTELSLAHGPTEHMPLGVILCHGGQPLGGKMVGAAASRQSAQRLARRRPDRDAGRRQGRRETGPRSVRARSTAIC